MENNIILSIEWKNADIYFPELENEPIVYCTANKEIGTLKSVKTIGNHLKKNTILNGGVINGEWYHN